jgi:hypothetical protein
MILLSTCRRSIREFWNITSEAARLPNERRTGLPYPSSPVPSLIRFHALRSFRAECAARTEIQACYGVMRPVARP